jgi:hypothetical protein
MDSHFRGNDNSVFLTYETTSFFSLTDKPLIHKNSYVFPSLTGSGRIRSDFKFDLKYDLPLDIYFGVGYTLNYDIKPVEGASETDYVFQTSVGWEL